MLYPRGTTYNVDDTIDTNNTLELSATFDAFQEFQDDDTVIIEKTTDRSH